MAFGYTTATISGITPGVDSVASLIQEVSSYLTGTLGWTLTEDRSDQAGTDHQIILQSNGEDDTASTFYLVLTSGNANLMGIQAATYWDTGTHTTGSGVASPSTVTSVGVYAGQGKTVKYWISGDKNSVNFISRTGGDYCFSHFGRIYPITTAANDPFPVVAVGTAANNNVDTVASTTNGTYGFLDATTPLGGNEMDWESLFTTPLDVNSTPDNIFGSIEKFTCFPNIVGVSDPSPDRKAIRGFSNNFWTTVGPSTTSLTQEDVFDPGTGKTYQVFFDSYTSPRAVVIRRS